MIQSLQIALLGGDERQIYMARALAAKGFQISVVGLGEGAEQAHPAMRAGSPLEALEGADVLLFPLPASVDGIHVNCPLDPAGALRFSEILVHWQGRAILGGKLPEWLCQKAEERGIRVIDYFEDDILQLQNAVPTAEGALAIAMRELPITIDGIRAAVIGYGRIGTVLADKLSALGAEVYLYARKERDLVRAAQRRLIPMRLSVNEEENSLCYLPRTCRVVFNTVPCPLFTRAALEAFPKDCVYIDLASAPGGIDWRAAKELGIHTVWGTALPGKCTPESAGNILADTIARILSTEEVDLC